MCLVYHNALKYCKKCGIMVWKKIIALRNYALLVKINYLEKMSSVQTDTSMKTGA